MEELRARFESWFQGLTGAQQALVAASGFVLGLMLVLPVLGVGLGLLLLALVLGCIFMWFEEMVWLMRQPDEVFPGRYDKLIWVALLIALPPLGVPALWAFRRKEQGKQVDAAYRDWA